MKKRIASLCLVLVLLSCQLIAVKAEPVFATRGRVLEMILEAADAYNEEIQASDIMKGDGDGNLRENDPVFRVEAMAMLSRAFPNLPQPSEYQLSIGNFGNSFIDLPEWAVDDLSNLTHAGIIAGVSENCLGAYDYVTEEQMGFLIRRIWAYLGNNLKDNFYMTQNKQWLNTASLSAGDLSIGTFSEAGSVTARQLQQIITSAAEGVWEADSKEQRIKDFYHAAADVKSRNERGIEPIRQYLDMYERATSVPELLNVHASVNNVTGNRNILGMFSDVDIQSGSRYVSYISGLPGILEKACFMSEDATAKQAYLKLVSDTLQIGGETRYAADKHAFQMYEMERQIALASLDSEDSYDVEKTYVRYDSSKVYRLFQKISPISLLQPWDKIGYFVLADEGRVLKTIEYLDGEHLEVLRTCMKFWLLQNTSSLLSQDLQQPYFDFVKTMYGAELSPDANGDAFSLVQSYLPECLEEDYVKRFCSPELKEEATTFVNEIKQAFRNRLEHADWLSPETRRNAVEKLDQMIVNVAYPDEFYDVFEGVSFTDDLFVNACMVQSFYMAVSQMIIGESVNHEAWPMYSYTVNAAYVTNYNSITIPAGILQAPFYDKNAEREENLAGIGVIIGHEITHAFDSSGSEFDKDGAYHNWWTKQDSEAFDEKCRQVELFYDSVEISNHAKCNGKKTVTENIADIGGMACALDIMKTLSNPDYPLFFNHYARIWREYNRSSYADYLAKNDVHSPGMLRVNQVIMNFQEFYDAFDIREGDGMYLPPEQRVSVW